jgi:D-glycero-alpha-D-manno-heptose 1-phosphate guanylyltransferase
VEAIILAGGLGKRLQNVVKDLPKPMADINGKPFLEYLLKNLLNFGIHHVILSVGYKQESINSYFGDMFGSMRISYSCEEEPLGTGGALKQALAYVENEYVFVFNGDTFFDLDLDAFRLKSLELKCDITLALKKMYNFDRYGSVALDSYGYIEKFNEKLFVSEGLINGGVYCIKKDIFSTIILPNHFSFESDFLEKMINNMRFGAYNSENYFIDIGIPADYEKAKIYFDDKKALFLDRDGIINKDKVYVYKTDKFEFTEGIFDLCRYLMERHYLIFIVTNQAGIARGYYSEDDFLTLTDWMKCQFEAHKITIRDVFYCPYHPQVKIERYTQACTCIKPQSGMILEAQKKYHLNLEHSILIGDKMSDITAGKSAGVGQTILIKSEYQEGYDFESVEAYLQYLRGEQA